MYTIRRIRKLTSYQQAELQNTVIKIAIFAVTLLWIPLTYWFMSAGVTPANETLMAAAGVAIALFDFVVIWVGLIAIYLGAFDFIFARLDPHLEQLLVLIFVLPYSFYIAIQIFNVFDKCWPIIMRNIF